MSLMLNSGTDLPNSGSVTHRNSNRAYAIDMSAAELERLVRLAELNDVHVRDAFARLPLGRGAKIADMGCGALGALLALSELVGPKGLVVGIDASRASLGQAGAILDRRGMANVELICAHLDELRPAIISPFGPFDATFCRAFLVHQPVPAQALDQIKSIVRQGGYIVLQEPLRAGVPALGEEFPAINEAWEMAFEVVERSGAAANVARDLAALCEKAGLTIISQRGFLNVTPAPAGTPLGQRFHDLLLGMRAAAVRLGVASEAAIEELLARLRAATENRESSLIGPVYLEVIARCPLT
jgi:SAM-dependent methyltransferase